MGGDDGFHVPHMDNVMGHFVIFGPIGNHKIGKEWVVDLIHGEFPYSSAEGNSIVLSWGQFPRIVTSILSIRNAIGTGVIPKQIGAQ